MSVTVRVALYAVLRDLTGRRDRFSVSVESGSMVSDLIRAVGLSQDDAGMVVVGGRVVGPDYVLSNGIEVDIFPPLSGG